MSVNKDKKDDIKIMFYIKDNSGNTIDPNTLMFKFRFYTNPNQKIVTGGYDGVTKTNCNFGPTNELFICLSKPNFLPGLLRGEINIRTIDGCFEDQFYDEWQTLITNCTIIDNTKFY